MNKWKKIIFLIFIEVFLVSFHVLAKQNYLVMIGNEKYTAEDFKWWWKPVSYTHLTLPTTERV